MVSVSAAESTVVNDEAGLIAAAAAGGEITVNEQINVFTQIVVKKDLVINLNNYISFFEALDATVPSNLVIEGASLTINCDDKIDAPKGILYAGKARLCSLVSTAERPATLTINNGNYHAGNVSRPEGFVCPDIDLEVELETEGVKKDDYCFKITVNDLEHQLIVRRDSGKMVTPVYKSVDMATNVSVNTTDSSVPLDTVMKVDELKSGTVYEDIIKTLDVEDNVTYDIKLQSESLDKHITKLNNGKFEVKIPVPEALKGQNLSVYYVDENKKITEHKTTKTDDGYAVFETDHFSIYTLAAKGDSPYTQSPATSDSPISVAAALASHKAVAFAYKKFTIHNA